MTMILLSILFPILEYLETKVQYDFGIPPTYAAIGLVVILAIGAGIIFLIILAIKFLIRLKRNNTKHD